MRFLRGNKADDSAENIAAAARLDAISRRGKFDSPDQIIPESPTCDASDEVVQSSDQSDETPDHE